MNSILQCLNASSSFSDELLSRGPPVSGGMATSMSLVFGGLRATGDPGAFDPKPLQQQVVSQFPWFRGKEQQDAHEFLRTLLGSLSDEYEQAAANSKAASSSASGGAGAIEGASAPEDGVARHFGGRLCAATLCWRCRRVTLRLDPYLDVPLHLPALHGQLVGAMGVTRAMATGEPDPAPPPGAGGDEASGEDSSADGSSKKAKRKGRAAAKAAAAAAKGPAAPQQPKAAKPRGVWGAAQDRAELMENARVYVNSLVLRVLRVQTGDSPEDADVQEAPVEVRTFEIELQRTSKQAQPQWGFMWSEAKCAEEQLVLGGVVEDSVLEKWNLKRRAMGDVELIVCVGDRLLEVNGETEYKDMSKTLRSADKVTLQFARGTIAPGSDLGGAQAESDGEEERKAAEKAKKEALRKAFCDSATSCHEALPAVLKEVFGPQKPLAQGSSEKILLEQCLHNFSAVEALEDDYKPVYNCSSCASERAGRTFASRRMWLIPGSLPPLLTLQLKRFRRYRERFEKSVASIVLPLALDLTEFVLSHGQLQDLKPFVQSGFENLKEDSAAGLRYELYGMCVHQGSSMRSGHYIAFVNCGPSLEQERWFEISDAKRRSVTRAEVQNAEAYVAFYRREGSGVAADAAALLAAAGAAEAATTDAGGAGADRDGDGDAEEEDGGSEGD